MTDKPVSKTREDLNTDEWVVCWECGGSGYVGHDCGEDTCCCLDPYENMDCQTCSGEGGWNPILTNAAKEKE